MVGVCPSLLVFRFVSPVPPFQGGGKNTGPEIEPIPVYQMYAGIGFFYVYCLQKRIYFFKKTCIVNKKKRKR